MDIQGWNPESVCPGPAFIRFYLAHISFYNLLESGIQGIDGYDLPTSIKTTFIVYLLQLGLEGVAEAIYSANRLCITGHCQAAY
jgi:hypothetical protein